MQSLGRGPVETPKTCTPVDARPEQPHGFQRNQSASFSERRIHRACAGWDAAAELRIQNIFDLGSGTFERDIEELHLAHKPYNVALPQASESFVRHVHLVLPPMLLPLVKNVLTSIQTYSNQRSCQPIANCVACGSCTEIQQWANGFA